jgi:3-deoxy-manno-octulosonate cytidylyltransferase (CMP-KDO synthetase)
MEEFRIIIPVRYDSTRLPGKPLLEIAGKPMIQHVYERALQSGAISVVIATDSEKIAKVAEGFGAAVCMTDTNHTSGTNRISEAVVKLGYNDEEIIVNIQGDEPLIPPEPIHQIAANLVEHTNAKMATICEPIESIEELSNPHCIKVALNRRGYALYFSRAPIPWDRNSLSTQKNKPKKLDTIYYRHRGIYAYRVNFLLEFMEWTPCELEKKESLEQLRTLWYGGKIHVGISKEKLPPDVNTPKDLEKICVFFKKNS